MKLYNTLTRKKEEFTPAQGNTVRMYSCGPTVYYFAHIGNLRTYVFTDTLRRALRGAGFQVFGVMNITDVGHLVSDGDEGEDKLEAAARERKESPWELAKRYTEAFFADLAALHIGTPEVIAKATENIPEMIAFVQALQEKGFAYETSDGVYFDISRFPSYGALSRLSLEQQQAGARVEVNEEKRHPADFALWKKAPREHIMQWESPWGMGYPGWHIECSAMSKKYLGDTFDLHTGGVDHIPVHHENEIAQSEALIGKPWVRCWLHAEFMMVNGGKMSKSLHNAYTLADLREKGFQPLDFRYFCLLAHYRSKENFTFEGLAAAQNALQKLYALTLRCRGAERGAIQTEALAQFCEAVQDDLNLPKALGIVWSMLKEGEPTREKYEALLQMDEYLGLGLQNAQAEKAPREDIPAEAAGLLAKRNAARKEKNWALSDQLRNELRALGYEVLDTPEGSKLQKLEK